MPALTATYSITWKHLAQCEQSSGGSVKAQILLQARAKQVLANSDEAGNPKESHAKRGRAILEVDDDDAYAEAERVMHKNKAAKLAKYTAPALQPPLDDEQINGARKVTKAVEKNRGLTPHRRKDTKNPRVKVSILDKSLSLSP